MKSGRYRILMAGCCVLAFGILAAWAQGRPACPPVLAGLMPRGSAHMSGQYTRVGSVGMGGAGADLAFDHPCTRSDRYPGHITVDVQYHQNAEPFQSQIASVEKQELQNEREELESLRAHVRTSTSTLTAMNPLKMEAAPGGTILYFDWYVDCSEGAQRSRPEARLFGVGHTGHASVTITADGFISAGVARAAAMEVLANFAKTDFSKAG